MYSLLAQADPTHSMFRTVTSIFSRADTLAHPRELLPALENLSIIWASIFLAAGIVCLFHGYRFYRVVTVMMALMIGAFVGFELGTRIQAAYIVAGCLGALLAVGCWPLMKYAVAVMGGLVGAFIGANAWSAVASLVHHRNGTVPQVDGSTSLHWVGALIGLIVVGMLAFILFKFSVVLFTSVSGATLALMGALALLMQIQSFRGDITTGISNNAVALPLLVMVPATIGLILQQASPDKGGGAPAGGGAKPTPKPA